jgi:peptide/nickel transport system permease protein
VKKIVPSKEEVDLSQHRKSFHINWPLLLGTLIVIFLIFIAIAGPQLAPKDPLEEHVILKIGDEWKLPPFRAFSVPGFPLGSDQFGRDLLSRVLWAIQPTLIMVALVSVVRLLLGGIIGLGAGWSAGRIGRWLDTSISAALAVPVLMVALGAIAMLGAELGLVAFIIGLSINGWGETARIVREQTQVIKGQLYIEAARAMGSSSLQILGRHVLRQIMPMIWMLFAFEISHTMMVTAALGFLGYYIGGDVWIEVGDFVSRRVSGTPELGQMLATSWSTLTEPWPMVLTGTVIFMIILGFNLFGEGLRMRIDPERASRNSPLARAARSTSWWLEQHITYPLGAYLREKALPIGITSLLLIAAGGGFLWWQSDKNDQNVPSQIVLPNPGGHPWSAERGNPYGTGFAEAQGVEDPQILWQLESEAGFSGGPVISAEGNLYIAARDSRLIALDSGGTPLWSTDLSSIPVGSPALDGSSNIYVVDVEGGLSKVNPDGAVLWHLEAEKLGTPKHGPIAAPDGRIYYLIEDNRNDHLVSVSNQGELIWVKETGTRMADSIPRLSPKGDMIFVKNKVIDTQDGSVMGIESPTAQDPVLSGREQFFTGVDGRTYIQTGHVIVQWTKGSSGLKIVQAAEWNYRSVGFNINASYPVDAGVAKGQVIWLFYSWQFGGTQIAWIDATGKLIGIAGYGMGARSRMVGVDENQIYYVCGVSNEWSSERGSICLAYAQGSTEPFWKLSLEGAEAEVLGAALVEDHLYVTTMDGIFFAVGEGPTPDRAEIGEEQTTIAAPTQESAGIPGTEIAPADADLLNAQIAWQYQVPEPFNEQFWYNFETTEDGWVYIHALTNNIYILNPQGELAYQLTLPAEPFQEPDRYTIQPIILPDKSLLLVTQENIVYGLAQDGSILWEMPLEAAPQAHPSLNHGQLYLVDRDANLYVFNNQGLVWRYKPEGETKGTSGALVGPDGTIYYTALVDRKAYVHALHQDGTLKWATAVRTGFFYEELKINGAGSLLFLKEDIYETQEGDLLDVTPPFNVDEYIMGQDGLTYLRSGHIIMQWELAEEGMQIVQTAQWNYDGVGSISGFTPSGPSFVRITPARVIWMFYFTQYVWLAMDGTVLGSPPSFGGTLAYADYLNTRLIYCSQTQGDEIFYCDVYTAGSDEPSQTVRFTGLLKTVYGFLGPTHAYAVTEDNIIYKINVNLPPP